MILQREKPSSEEAVKLSNDSKAVVLKSISCVQVMLQLLKGTVSRVQKGVQEMEKGGRSRREDKAVVEV